jgi:hypothetical protein
MGNGIGSMVGPPTVGFEEVVRAAYQSGVSIREMEKQFESQGYTVRMLNSGMYNPLSFPEPLEIPPPTPRNDTPAPRRKLPKRSAQPFSLPPLPAPVSAPVSGGVAGDDERYKLFHGLLPGTRG